MGQGAFDSASEVACAVTIRNLKSEIERWLCTHLRIFTGCIGSLCRSVSVHDTDRITYRCFLPDLTRFATVCCVVSDQNGPNSPVSRSLGGNSAPHQADFGKRAPLAPRLAQPGIKIRQNVFFARKILIAAGSRRPPQASNTQYPVPTTQHPVPSTQPPAPDIRKSLFRES